jgi:hypothetical protein
MGVKMGRKENLTYYIENIDSLVGKAEKMEITSSEYLN